MVAKPKDGDGVALLVSGVYNDDNEVEGWESDLPNSYPPPCLLSCQASLLPWELPGREGISWTVTPAAAAKLCALDN